MNLDFIVYGEFLTVGLLWASIFRLCLINWSIIPEYEAIDTNIGKRNTVNTVLSQ